MSKREYPRCPLCTPATAAPTKKVQAGGYEVITDSRKLHAVAVDRLRDVREEHAMKEDDILFLYALPESADKIDCSYGHPTRKGVVARTRCGKMMFLGYDCADDRVDGFEAATKMVERTNTYERQKANIARFPTLITRIEAALVDVARLVEFLKSLNAEPFVTECRRRAKEGAGALEVQVPLDGGKFGVERLVGISLWDWSITTTLVVRGTLAKALDARDEWATSLATPQLAKRLSKAYSDLEKQCKVYEEMWSIVAEQFFSERNIAVALHTVRGWPPKKPEGIVAAEVTRIRTLFDEAKSARQNGSRTNGGAQ